MKQNYSSSQSILGEIKIAKNILINVHRNPDLDSIGSATALYQALIKIGKKVTLVCPHEIPENFKFLKGAEKVQIIDFMNFKNFINLTNSDLFLIADSGSYDIVTGSKEVQLPDIKKIIIDHHQTNNWTKYVSKLLDIEASSTSEIVYKLLLDWEIEIDSEIATSLFSGIASDTVFFKYEKNSKKTFRIATELLEKGADKDKLIEQAFDSFDFNLIQTMGEFLTKMKKETSLAGGFVYSIMDNETFVKFGKHRGARETVANLFARSIKGFDFGFIAVEYEQGKFAVSFRSKKDTDVSVIAKKLGGGGHKNAAGATVYGSIDQVIKKIKETV
ncbi:MAG: bifunctional oligoribonuclease/PAP phosphatase NrnA [Patescibacteria group bacterium]